MLDWAYLIGLALGLRGLIGSDLGLGFVLVVSYTAVTRNHFLEQVFSKQERLTTYC